MMEKGYIDKNGMTAKDLVSSSANGELMTIDIQSTIADAFKKITYFNYSTLPVTKDNRIIGSISESLIYNHILKNPDVKNHSLDSIMGPALPFVDVTTPLDVLSNMMIKEESAVLVKDFQQDKTYIITKYDIVQALSK